MGWNIYRDFSDKGRLKVDCYIGNYIDSITGIHKEDLLIWSITNVGNRSVLITNVGGRFHTHEFLLNTRNRMPYKLEPGEYIIEYSDDLTVLTDNLKDLVVADSLGKIYKASNKRLKQAIRSAKNKAKK